MEFFEVGKIINTHGIKGELKIESTTDFDRFEPGNTVYIDEVPFVIASHRIHKGFDLVSFKGLDNINDVLIYKGKFLYVDETVLEDLPEGEFYFHELIGLAVYNQDDCFIGEVFDVRDLPQGEILEIKREGKRNALVPFVKEFIKEVTEKKIVINEIEGLL